MKRALAPVADLESALDGRELIGCSAGPDGALWAVGTREKKSIVLRADENGVERMCEVAGAIHFAQPLGDEVVVAHGRSALKKGARVANARRIARDGKTKAFAIGDGVQELQTTHDGQIWCSYFDEGVFGETVATEGLNAFDREGVLTFSYDPAAAGTETIDDCYALNVADDENVWLYFYSEFALVHLRRRRVAGVWKCPVHGARAFAVARDRLLISGGYDAHERFGLYAIEKQRLARLADVGFVDENSGALGKWSFGRGAQLHFIAGTRWYRADLHDLA